MNVFYKYQALEEERIQEQNERIERIKFQQRLDAQMEQKVILYSVSFVIIRFQMKMSYFPTVLAWQEKQFNILFTMQQNEEKMAYENFLKEKKMIDEIIAKVKEEERKRILDEMHKRQVEQETIR